jgi:hypothetical protein
LSCAGQQLFDVAWDPTDSLDTVRTTTVNFTLMKPSKLMQVGHSLDLEVEKLIRALSILFIRLVAQCQQNIHLPTIHECYSNEQGFS